MMVPINHVTVVCLELSLYGSEGTAPSPAEVDLAILDEAKRIKEDRARYDAAIALNRARTQQLLRNLNAVVQSDRN